MGETVDLKPVTVRHPPIESGKDEAIDEFERLLADGFKEWNTRNGITMEKASQQLRESLLYRLLRKAASLMTPETIAKIHGADASAAHQRALVNQVSNELGQFLRLDLIFLSGIPLRGRKRERGDRDRKIRRMRRAGLSHGAIGRTLKMSRNAVQAADRREGQRRDLLRSHYTELKEFFGVVGIILEKRSP